MQFRFTDESRRAIVAAFEDGRASFDGEADQTQLFPTHIEVDDATVDIHYVSDGDSWSNAVEMRVESNDVPWVVEEALDAFHDVEEQLEYSSSVVADPGDGSFLFALTFD